MLSEFIEGDIDETIIHLTGAMTNVGPMTLHVGGQASGQASGQAGGQAATIMLDAQNWRMGL